ncbi:MAG: 3'-5' exoribonuclease [Aquisalimonadaceae bacterium]
MSRFRSPPQDIFISTDVESDGPVPGLNSMLSFGSVAITQEGELTATFTRNLDALPEARPHANTMAWWEDHPEAWKTARDNPQAPGKAMKDYLEWLRALDGRPVFVGFPASFDFPFINYYLHRFTGEAPFATSALDITSYAMAVLQHSSFSRTSREKFPGHWFEAGLKQEHVALDDAIQQGLLFMNMYRENQARGFPEMPEIQEFDEMPPP